LFDNINYSDFLNGGIYDVENSKLIRYEGKIKNDKFYVVLKSKPLSGNE